MYYSSLPRRTKPMKRTAISSKPKAVKAHWAKIAVYVYPDKRERCLKNEVGRKEYAHRRDEMTERQCRLCAICRLFMVAPQFDHEAGRHPTRIDERLLKPDGVTWRNASLCDKCNCHIKGSRHYEWVEGNTRYIPVERAA